MRVIRVTVKTGARASELQVLADGSYQARLKSPPVDGKANAELVELIAAQLCIQKSQIRIKSGAASRTKMVQITTP